MQIYDYKVGNILLEKTDAIVNPVNCVGVMGRGLALQFKKTFPDNYQEYVKICEQKKLYPGKLFVYRTCSNTPPQYIINFPTKRHWKDKSYIEDIEIGLKELVNEIRDRKIQSIAIPPLGCGLGGLPWEEVHSRIKESLSVLEFVHIIIYQPI